MLRWLDSQHRFFCCFIEEMSVKWYYFWPGLYQSSPKSLTAPVHFFIISATPVFGPTVSMWCCCTLPLTYTSHQHLEFSLASNLCHHQMKTHKVSKVHSGPQELLEQKETTSEQLCNSNSTRIWSLYMYQVSRLTVLSGGTTESDSIFRVSKFIILSNLHRAPLKRLCLYLHPAAQLF